MNILFLTIINITDINERGIYTDLMRKFREEGHLVYIVSPNERRYKIINSLSKQDEIYVLKVRTLNLQKTNLLEKGIGSLLLEYQFFFAIRKMIGKIKFDLVLYSTPPITFTKVVQMIKRRYSAKSYLLLKDIFPQNAVDLGFIKSKGVLYRYFRNKEMNMYEISDYIGCMSPANVNYLLKHNPELTKENVEVCPNSISPNKDSKISIEEKHRIRLMYNLPNNDIIYVYGGNLGKPQGMSFLLEVLRETGNIQGAFFLIAGSGTEFSLVSNWFQKYKPKNASLMSILPKREYDILLKACDVGMIFLNKCFTIPNYPSRLLSYLEYRMPIITATDTNTDVGSIAVENNYGLWSEYGKVKDFCDNVLFFMKNKSKINEMGENGYRYMLNNYTVENSYKTIMNHFK